MIFLVFGILVIGSATIGYLSESRRLAISETATAKVVVPYVPLPAAKDPNTGIELSAQQNTYQFRFWILPVGTKIIYPDGTEKILFEKGFLTMAKKTN